jgi:hypothetical protein
MPAIQKALLKMANRKGQLNDAWPTPKLKKVKTNPIIVRAVQPMATPNTILRGNRCVAKNTTPAYNISSANPRGSRRSNVKTPAARIIVNKKSLGWYNLIEYIQSLRLILEPESDCRVEISLSDFKAQPGKLIIFSMF